MSIFTVKVNTFAVVGGIGGGSDDGGGSDSCVCLC